MAAARFSADLSQFANEVDRLASLQSWSYLPGGPSAAEPAAWTVLALTAGQRFAAARRPARWLATLQQPSGAVGVSQRHPTPRWPTSLAIRAWHALDTGKLDPAIPAATGPDAARHPAEFQPSIARAVEWALGVRGNTGPRKPQVGHDTTIPGWSWAENTHSWLEPTCFFVDALGEVGYRNHPRTRDGVRMIVDRLLPTGGCNYGNTFALGQMLLPHVQSTGIALSTLAVEAVDDPRIEKSLAYLEHSIDDQTPTASLCFALAGLAAHGRLPAEAGAWLEQRIINENQSAVPSAQRLALLLFTLGQVAPNSLPQPAGVA